MLRCTLTLVLTLLGLVLGGCVTNAATGDRFFSPLSPSEEIRIGIDAKPGLVQEMGGEISSPRIRAYVTQIGQRMAALTEADNPKLPWEFTILDSAVINAFALPGGKVFISRGLLERMTNESQLAGVLGHEIGHVTAQHTARRIGQATLLQTGIAVAGAVVSSTGEGSAVRGTGEAVLPALSVGGQLLVLKFGRDEESQSDSLGMRYMTRAGYNPTGQLQVMQILKAASGGARQPEFLATHPLPETRIERIKSELRKPAYASDAARTDNVFEQRFQQECLAVLRTLPPPTQRAETTVRQLIARASPNGCCAGCGLVTE
ncbi:MAG: M48 family metalloprotease [Phycisphaerales bacterium]